MYDLVCCSSATKNKRMTWLQAISETFFKFLLHHRAWKNIAKTGHKLSMKTTQGTQHVTIKVHGRWPRWVYSNYWKWRKLLRSWQNPTKLKRPKMRTFEDAAPFFVPLHPHPFSNLNTPKKKTWSTHHINTHIKTTKKTTHLKKLPNEQWSFHPWVSGTKTAQLYFGIFPCPCHKDPY